MRGCSLGAALLAVGVTAHAQPPADALPGGASAAALGADSVTAAQTPSPITDHVALRAIFFWGHVDTTGQFNSVAGVPGTTFSAERDLGLTDQARQVRVEIVFRLEQRSRLRLNFLDLRRQGQKQLDRILQYGNQTFSANALVQSQLNWRQTDFTYTYSFLRTDRYELGAGMGVHLIEAYASAQIPHTTQRGTFSEAGPFATPALDGTWRLSTRWALSARAQYFELRVDSSSGMLGDYHADLQYRWRPNMAFGAGYEYQRIEVNVPHADPAGTVQMNINGPELFARLSF